MSVAITDTTIKSAPTPEPIPVVDYDVRFIGDTVQLTMWPTLGDTVEELPDQLVFKFPRLGVTQVVFTRNAIGLLRFETRRVPFDIEKFKRDLEGQQKPAQGRES